MDDARVPLKVGFAMCAETCSGAGHGLHPIQTAVASSAPGSWIDGLAQADGHSVTFQDLDGTARTFWHHGEIDLVAGEPVAFHPVAGVLSVRGALLNIREL
ncbi:nuclease [Microbacterium sp. 18062]|uniref:nuclease n=1 Tax=Microbacterium sp. 18062 TaxID=2681410 RepID=UPI001356B8F9|nr:nuclease [Microbacterium sp. 18062]